MTPSQSPSTRQYPRRPFHRTVGVLISGVYTLSRGSILGEGGMSLFLPLGLKEGQQIAVSFQVPHSDFLILRSEVRSVMHEQLPYGTLYGIQFLEVDFNQKRKIRSFVAARGENEK